MKEVLLLAVLVSMFIGVNMVLTARRGGEARRREEAQQRVVAK